MHIPPTIRTECLEDNNHLWCMFVHECLMNSLLHLSHEYFYHQCRFLKINMHINWWSFVVGCECIIFSNENHHEKLHFSLTLFLFNQIDSTMCAIASHFLVLNVSQRITIFIITTIIERNTIIAFTFFYFAYYLNVDTK